MQYPAKTLRAVKLKKTLSLIREGRAPNTVLKNTEPRPAYFPTFKAADIEAKVFRLVPLILLPTYKTIKVTAKLIVL